ncbi:MAG: ATP-binding protein [Spirochaetota bacterium]
MEQERREGVMSYMRSDDLSVPRMGWKEFLPLFDHSADAVVVVTPEEGEVLYTNRRAEELFGASSGELVGLNQTDLHPPERRDEIVEGFRDFARRMTHDIPVVREEIVRRDGTRLPVEIRSGTFTELGGRLVLYAIFRDISAERTVERELEATKEQLTDIVNSIPGAVYQVERSPAGSMNVSKMSGNLRQLVGLSADELEGSFEKVRERVLAEDVPSLETAIAASAESLSKFEHVFRITRVDGPQQVRSVKAAATPHRRSDGTVVWNGVLLDVSEQADLERSAIESAKYKSHFIASCAHDMRTPINVALGYTELVLEDEPDEAKADQLRQAREALRFQLELLQDVTHLSQLEAGRVAITQQPVSVRGVVDAVAGLFRAKAENRGIELYSRVATEVPRYVWLDSRHVKQALMNLLANAFKFTEYGHVELSADYRSGALQFRVSDSGPGISQDLRPRLFDPFEQGEHGHGGSGLGLSIVREIAHACGGTVEVEKSNQTGSVFLLQLPGQARDAEPPYQAADIEDVVATWYERAGSADLPREIVDEAIDVVIERGDELSDIRSTADPNALHRVLHDLKGMAANVSMSEVEKLAAQALSHLAQDPPDVAAADNLAGHLESLAAALKDTRSESGITRSAGEETNPRATGSVLLAEDNAANRKLFRSYLQRLGLEPFVASDGREALDTLLRERIELAILDMEMPGMTGVEVVQRLREADAGAQPRFIAITGYGFVQRPQELEEFDAYLTKPVGEAEMRTAVTQWLKRP